MIVYLFSIGQPICHGLPSLLRLFRWLTFHVVFFPRSRTRQMTLTSLEHLQGQGTLCFIRDVSRTRSLMECPSAIRAPLSS